MPREQECVLRGDAGACPVPTFLQWCVGGKHTRGFHVIASSMKNACAWCRTRKEHNSVTYPASSKGRQTVPGGLGPPVQQAEVRRQPTTPSQVDVNVETLLQEDGNGTSQIHCEIMRKEVAGGSGG